MYQLTTIFIEKIKWFIDFDKFHADNIKHKQKFSINWFNDSYVKNIFMQRLSNIKRRKRADYNLPFIHMPISVPQLNGCVAFVTRSSQNLYQAPFWGIRYLSQSGDSFLLISKLAFLMDENFMFSALWLHLVCKFVPCNSPLNYISVHSYFREVNLLFVFLNPI